MLLVFVSNGVIYYFLLSMFFAVSKVFVKFNRDKNIQTMSLVKFITVGSIDSVLQHISSFIFFSRPSLNKLRTNNL